MGFELYLRLGLGHMHIGHVLIKTSALELNTQTREDKRERKVKLTQKSKEDNFERKIQELYQTSEDSGIRSKLDSTLTPKLLIQL